MIMSNDDILPLRFCVQEGRACLLDIHASARTKFNPFVVVVRRTELHPGQTIISKNNIYPGLGIRSFQKNVPFFPFFYKERSVLSVLLRSL